MYGSCVPNRMRTPATACPRKSKHRSLSDSIVEMCQEAVMMAARALDLVSLSQSGLWKPMVEQLRSKAELVKEQCSPCAFELPALPRNSETAN